MSRKYEIGDYQNIIDENEILHRYCHVNLATFRGNVLLLSQRSSSCRRETKLLDHLTLNVKTLHSIKIFLVLACLIVNIR